MPDATTSPQTTFHPFEVMTRPPPRWSLILVTTKISASRARPSGARWAMRIAAMAAVALVALAACGSSKPAYCTARTNLKNSVMGLANFNPSAGVSGLKSQLTKIQSDAKTLVNQAKSDFPSQTSAITDSVNAFASSVEALPANPSAGQAAKVATTASSVVSSTEDFVNASKSKCS